ncbi:MAG: DUF2190 family protein [Clostridium sp.]|nr:DUF2190 family protein [Clostridium sp.]
MRKNQEPLWPWGDPVKFDDATGIDKDADGTATVGYAVEAAKAEESTAFVKLLG